MEELKKLLKMIIREEMTWSGAPGAVFALQQGNKSFILTEGLRDREKQLPVTENTHFVIASCSKSMTAAMLGRLVDEGVLDWDRPVTTWCPYLVMKDPEAAGMTLRDMLLHRTGLADHDGMWPDAAGRDELARRLRYLDSNLKFREKHQYNNVMYALAAHVAECATGKSYPALMQEYIFDPLDMRETYSEFAKYAVQKDLALPYYFNREANAVIRQELWNMDSAVPAAAICTTAGDMLKWLRFNLSGGLDGAGRRLLSEDSWKNIHYGQIDYREAPLKDFLRFDKYAFGWRAGLYRGRKIYKHTGKINGYSSLEVFIPELDAVCFASLNLECPEQHLYLRAAYSAFDWLCGIRDGGKTWEYVFRVKGEAPTALYHSHDFDLRPAITGNGKGHKRLSEYEGEYFHPGYGPLRILEEDGSLTAYHRNYRIPLRPYDGDCFEAPEFWEDIKYIAMPLDFRFERPGQPATAVILPMEPQVSPIRFERV